MDLCKEVGLSGPYLVDGNKSEVEKEELRKVLGMSTLRIWTNILLLTSILKTLAILEPNRCLFEYNTCSFS